MLKIINRAWSWIAPPAIEIIAVNDFGNIIFLTEQQGYWRICPEELSCEKIAADKTAFEQTWNSPDFSEDWNMTELVTLAKNTLGELTEGEKYCLKMPGVLGGAYEASNLGKIGIDKLIDFSGDLGRQVSGLEDGQRVAFEFNPRVSE